jgi:hypothetical protein
MTRTVLDTAPAILARIARLDPADALTQVAAVRAALPSCGVPERPDELAAALPARVGMLAPELTLELASLAGALVSHAPRLPEDIDALEHSIEVAAAWIEAGQPARAAPHVDAALGALSLVSDEQACLEAWRALAPLLNDSAALERWLSSELARTRRR